MEKESLTGFCNRRKRFNITPFVSFWLPEVWIVKGSHQVTVFHESLGKVRNQKRMAIERVVANDDGFGFAFRLPDVTFELCSIMLKPFFNMFCALLEFMWILLVWWWHHHDSLEFFTSYIDWNGLEVKKIVNVLVSQFLLFVCGWFLLVDFLSPYFLRIFCWGKWEIVTISQHRHFCMREWWKYGCFCRTRSFLVNHFGSIGLHNSLKRS